ncbi:antitoxin protein of toxin-antitoxin system [Nonomuraea fuscirosea]|uniref:Antitoxin protein of toxin-antitoxin system n=1 Tax=Nonomuraea fuscirosea TaxID=1291556 RepID=A0A2T0N3K9_9ACTN|nr:antitoxin [Nonomuraea fuscirosea]PRX66687.1 antitoxin protein of toxin-antitoxin system [Nonomuraea fuscirosea]
MSRIAEWLKKAENLARGHSKQADRVLDRAEEFAKERTGHKYDDQISKGADAVQQRYGGGQPGQQQGHQQPGQPAGQETQEERERRMPPQG